MSLESKKSMGFSSNPLHTRKEPGAFHYMAQRTSFWIAVLSVFAYIAGNMMGQHGWHTFWASVIGAEDHSTMVQEGTVLPLKHTVDYDAWARYGGSDVRDLTFRHVPQVARRVATFANLEISTGHKEGYHRGPGSHGGVDYRVPVGTPAYAFANGVVSDVKREAESGGFGNVIVIRHPNMPDPDGSRQLVTLYSSYAHLQTVLVNVGDVVSKGDQIALTGDTGMVTGPHLHFQIDRDTAPWRPYWAFTGSEARRAGLTTVQAVNAGLHRERLTTYSVAPLAYMKAHAAPVTTVALKAAAGESEDIQATIQVKNAPKTAAERRAERMRLREERRNKRLAARRFVTRTAVTAPKKTPEPVVKREEIVSAAESHAGTSTEPTVVMGVEIQHDGSFTGRGWETVRVILTDDQGHTVYDPVLKRDITLRTAYGKAEFRPGTLTQDSFVDGVAEVKMLPRGRQTIMLQPFPFNEDLSKPMRYERCLFSC